MMKKLIKNELIKLTRQTSYRVMTIILAVLILIISVGGWILSLVSDSLSGLIDDSAQEVYEYCIEAANDTENVDAVHRAYYADSAEMFKFFIDNGIDESWKYGYYFDQYSSAHLAAAALRRIAEGEFTPEQIANSDYSYYAYDYIYYKDDEGELKLIEDRSYYTAGVAELMSELEPLQQKIISASPTQAVEEEKADVVDLYESALESLAEADAALEKKPDDVGLRYEAERCTEVSENFKKLNELYDVIIEKNCDIEDWRYITVAGHYYRSVLGLNETVVMPEELYTANESETYEQYREQTEEQHKMYEEAAAIFEHSVRNDIPVGGVLSNAKSSFESAISSSMGLLLIIAIIMGGLTVSQEFSSGTIRLLLIRPRTRAKIFTSKHLALLIYIGVMTAFTVVVAFATTLIAHGAGDLFCADLVYIGGRVAEIPSVFGALSVIGANLLMIFFFTELAILFSVLVKKAALSIAMPIIINGIGSTVQTVAITFSGLFRGMRWLNFTPLPYVDLTIFGTTSAEYIASMNTGSLTSLIFNANSMMYEMTLGTYPWLGVAYYIVLTAALVALSYNVFTKTQIKN